MTDRCEPPPELRDVDGWHWIASDGDEVAMFWQSGDEEWLHGNDDLDPEHVAKFGGFYRCPVATPAEVEALRAEVMRASTECADAMAQVATIRARVARMEELVRSAYAEGWADGETRQYDTAADAWEWAAARAALSAETP